MHPADALPVRRRLDSPGMPAMTKRLLVALFAVLCCAVALPAARAQQAAAPAATATAAPAAKSDLSGKTRGELRAHLRKWTGDFDGILQRRVLRVLVVNSKTQYYVDKGLQRGTAYEEGRALEDWLNQKHKGKTAQKNLKIHVTFVPVSREELIPALVEGRGDLAIAALTVTPQRQAQVDFTQPTFRNVSEIAVTGPASPALARVDDLSGKEIFVRKSSSYYQHLVALNERFAKEAKAPAKLREAPDELEDEDLLEMVNAGLVPIVIVDSYKAELWAKILPAVKLNPDVAVNAGGEIAWALRKNSPLLMAEANAFIATHGQGSAFGNTVYKKYFGSTKFAKSATSPEEIAKFNRMVDVFRKHGEQYDMDYLLMMAQGFQESRLDQNAKSHVGAVGVMQVMPATGKELKVGDITVEPNNIHAGGKYMRFMIDQYYEKEPMSRLNKALFAFAAYNAGPGRIRQMRAEAEKRGLNPNKWFDNVELVVAEKVGTETVTYVANIYKYYVAYKLVVEEQEQKRKAMDDLRQQVAPK
jgi:membrane-bound lytic murein transglycosylase MltF